MWDDRRVVPPVVSIIILVIVGFVVISKGRFFHMSMP